MKKCTKNGLAVLLLTLIQATGLWAADGSVKLGISASTSGNFAEIGASAKNGAELARKEINAAGGVQTTGGKTYSLEVFYGDNASNKSTAVAEAVDRIGKDQVLALVGPMSSDRAIAVSEVANAYKTPLVSPWSTSPLTTMNRPYAFRVSVMHDIQAIAVTKIAAKEWQAAKAAVIYDELNPDCVGMAKAFRKTFEEVNGKGAVLVFETFRTGQNDFTKQLNAAINSKADVLFIPQYYDEVPLLVQQARKLGWKKPITGSNSWAGGDLPGKCGDACTGALFVGNFAPGGAKGPAKAFADSYQKTYNKQPDEVAALTYDAVRLVVQAVQNTGRLTGNVVQDRIKVRDQLAAIKNYQGVTGSIGYNGNGDPAKCAAVIRIDEKGQLTTHDTVCP